jgi:hypothetical protein
MVRAWQGGEDGDHGRHSPETGLASALMAGRVGGECERAWPCSRRKGNGGGREKGGAAGMAPILKGVGGMEQRRGAGLGWRHMARRWWRGVRGGGAARRSGGGVGRQWPEAGGRGRHGTPMQHGRFE